MKYSCEITIDLARDKVIEIFDSTENLYKWQPTLESFEHLSGEPGQAGAKSRLVYDTNGRKMEMIETITGRNLPDDMSFTYEAKNVKNWVVNRFSEEAPGKTRWVMDNVFKCSGFMAVVAFVGRGAFPKQTLKDMNRFKDFAEAV